MQTKPSFINENDYKCLIEKYNGKKLERIINKVENNYPIQYAIGYVPFLDTKIIVNKSVLIPRFETELLVYLLKEYIKKCDFNNANIIDLCTGSGCIAISLKKEFPTFSVFGVDKSIKAIRLAKKNAKINNQRIIFRKKDVLKSLEFDKKFSILVANPPYVKKDEFVTENTKFEPKMALFPGEDDIIFYKKILDNSKNLLYKKNIIAFEIGSTQSSRICEYAKKIYPNSEIVVRNDYNNYDRFIFIFNNCE